MSLIISIIKVSYIINSTTIKIVIKRKSFHENLSKYMEKFEFCSHADKVNKVYFVWNINKVTFFRTLLIISL